MKKLSLIIQDYLLEEKIINCLLSYKVVHSLSEARELVKSLNDSPSSLSDFLKNKNIPFPEVSSSEIKPLLKAIPEINHRLRIEEARFLIKEYDTQKDPILDEEDDFLLALGD